MRRRFSRVALAISAVAVVAIAGGASYAVAEIGGGGVLNGCYKSENGQLRLIDPATDSCHPSETAISWSQTGPQGPKGDKGDKGDPGASGASVNGITAATFVSEVASLTPGRALVARDLTVRILNDIPAGGSVRVELVANVGGNFGDGSAPTAVGCTITGTAGNDTTCTAPGPMALSPAAIIFMRVSVRGAAPTTNPQRALGHHGRARLSWQEPVRVLRGSGSGPLRRGPLPVLSRVAERFASA
jgi:hypothetical protein